LNTFLELIDVQEKLVDIISLDNKNINNYEIKYENFRHLFNYYIWKYSKMEIHFILKF